MSSPPGDIGRSRRMHLHLNGFLGTRGDALTGDHIQSLGIGEIKETLVISL